MLSFLPLKFDHHITSALLQKCEFAISKLFKLRQISYRASTAPQSKVNLFCRGEKSTKLTYCGLLHVSAFQPLLLQLQGVQWNGFSSGGGGAHPFSTRAPATTALKPNPHGKNRYFILTSVTFALRFFIAVSIISFFHENVFDFCPAVGPSMQPLVEGNGDLLVFERISYRLARLFDQLPPNIRRMMRVGGMKRGDVVIAVSGEDSTVRVCKRIAALPDDIVLIPVDPSGIFFKPNSKNTKLPFSSHPKSQLKPDGDGDNNNNADAEADAAVTRLSNGESIQRLQSSSHNNTDDDVDDDNNDDAVGAVGAVQSVGAAVVQLYRIPPGFIWLQGDNVKDSNDSRHYGPVPVSYILGRVVCKIWPLHKAKWMRSLSSSSSSSMRTSDHQCGSLKSKSINEIPADLKSLVDQMLASDEGRADKTRQEQTRQQQR